MTRDSILSDLVALPPGKLPDDKYYVGFFRGETLLAQMDLIADYPERAMAYIGLFMMEASVQQAGIELWRICVVIWQRKESAPCGSAG